MIRPFAPTYMATEAGHTSTDGTHRIIGVDLLDCQMSVRVMTYGAWDGAVYSMTREEFGRGLNRSQ